MRPGGRLRISTPDLEFLVGLQKAELSQLQKDYMDYARGGLSDDLPLSPAAVLNNFVRAWGHEFIYDQSSLKDVLHEVGFIEVTKKNVSESDVAEFAGRDHVQRMPAGHLNLESMVFEAVRP